MMEYMLNFFVLWIHTYISIPCVCLFSSKAVVLVIVFVVTKTLNVMFLFN